MSLYRPFLDYAFHLIREKLPTWDYPIKDGFREKRTVTGKGKKAQEVITTSYALASEKLRQIRAAMVEGGDSLQVLNFVIFPHLHYDLPFFGADLVTLPGGHLIALDMQPLFHTPDYLRKYSDPLLPLFQKYRQQLAWGGDIPEEAKPFFSPIFLWTRPQKTEIVQTVVFSAFQDYLQAYIQFVQQAERITDSQRLAAIRLAQWKYVRYRAEKDPARGMFTRLYGQDWTEEYIHGFLFDLLRCPEMAPLATPPEKL